MGGRAVRAVRAVRGLGVGVESVMFVECLYIHVPFNFSHILG